MHSILKEMQNGAGKEEAINPLSFRTGIERIHLETALALQIHGSFRKAAEALGTKAKSAARRLRELEFQLGTPLFERRGPRLVPTCAGGVFLRRSTEILANFHMLVEAVRRMADGKAGEVAIGYHGPVAHGALRELLLESHDLLPETTRVPVELSHDRMADALASSKIDIAILRGQPDDFPGRSMALWTERIVIVLPADHPLLAKNILHWPDLAGETFLVSRHDPCGAIRRLLADRLAPYGAEPDISVQDVSATALLHMVGTGHGICLSLESVLGDHYAGAEYRDLFAVGGPEYVTTYACWREDNRNPALARFLGALQRRYAMASSS